MGPGEGSQYSSVVRATRGKPLIPGVVLKLTFGQWWPVWPRIWGQGPRQHLSKAHVVFLLSNGKQKQVPGLPCAHLLPPAGRVLCVRYRDQYCQHIGLTGGETGLEGHGLRLHNCVASWGLETG